MNFTSLVFYKETFLKKMSLFFMNFINLATKIKFDMKKISITFIIVMSIIIACKQTPKDIKAQNQTKILDKELTIKIDSINILGNLMYTDTTENCPLVIIVAGSGPTDRDGNNKLGIKAQPYKILADSLSNYNIATFRYDKRAIGESTKVKEVNLRFEHYVSDVVKIVEYFQKNHKFSKIYILGHSEGALIGAIASSMCNVNGFISASGTSKPAYEILKQQLSTNKEIDQKELDRVLNELKQGRVTILNDKDLLMIFSLSVQPYIISWFKYNPLEVYSKISVPTLIVHGTTDIQVPVDQAEELKTVTPNSEIAIIEEMNHIFKKAPKDKTLNQLTYINPQLPVCSELVQNILKFINK